MTLKTALLSAAATLALAPAAFAERGADGELKILYWQAVSTMNPYLSAGIKDVQGSSLVLEPLAGFDPKGAVFPRLAAEIPTKENGGLADDLMTVTWKLKPDLKWSDGSAVTADDVVFTANYCMSPEGGCAQLSLFDGIEKVEAVDPLTVKITFTEPKSNPLQAFVSSNAPVLQKAQFEACLGAAAPTCTEQNFKPIGTGPFQVVDFKTNDVVQLTANPNYRDPAKPAFATATLKGGGDAVAATRAVMETGEFDYAWNTQIAPEVQEQMLTGGKGEFVSGYGSLVERLEVNLSDPSSSLPEGERSTIKHPHPILTDPKVRAALSKAIDRSLLAEIGYGVSGKANCDLVPAPEQYAANNQACLTQDVEGAKKLLDEAGWTVGAGGIRQKDGKPLKLLFQTSVNPIRQDFQALIKQWWQDIGVDTELKTVDASVFFGSDPSSPDTFKKFYADIEMYANNFDGTDPEGYLAERTCEKATGPGNQWQGENLNRYCDAQYDKLIAELGATSDPAKRGELVKTLNNMLTVDSDIVMPLTLRARFSARSKALGGVDLNPWDSELWNVADWYRVK